MEENKTVELEKRPRVISVFSSKGGVGKTTTSTNIAYNLSQFGYKCLVIDFDPQNNASIALNVDYGQLGEIDDPIDGTPNIGSILFPYLVKGRTNTFSASHIAKVIQRPTYIVKEMQKDENGKVIFGKWGEEQKEFGFDILPAIGMDLSLCELSFTMDTAFINQHLPNSRALLASVVDIIKKRFDYDFIIIDCCPSLGILNMNALNASDYLIIPTSMDYFAINGVKQTISRLEDIKKFTPNFKIIGVLKQMFQSKRMVDTAISGILENDFDINDIGYIFETPIPDSIEARKSSIEGRLLSQKAKDKAAIAYRKVTQELLERIACLESEEE